jgi:hypothetical protein
MQYILKELNKMNLSGDDKGRFREVQKHFWSGN